MDRFISSKQKIKYLLVVLTLFLAFGCCAFGVFSTKNAFAEEQVKTQDFLPLSSIEQYELSSPLDVYFDDEVTAILSGNDSHQSLTVYYNGTFFEITQGSFSALKKVDRIKDTLVLADNAILKGLSLNDINGSIVNLDINGGCATFDVSGDFLSTIYNNNLFVYEYDGENFNQIATSANATSDAVLACNSSGAFYVKDGKIVYSSYENFTSFSVVKDVTPTHLIANDEYVYYVLGSEIYSIKIGEENAAHLTKPESSFDLGKIVNVNGFTFKGENLLITDSSQETIQEFKVDGDDLIFTGFAIAKDKTAYNRISKTAFAVDYYGENVAVLDDQKLTVIKSDLSDYSAQNFINFSVKDQNVNAICLGKNTALLISGKQVYALDLLSKTKSELITTTDYTILDVCYESGTYYVLSSNYNDGGFSYVRKINESDLSVASNDQVIVGYSFTDIEVDLFGDIYFSDDNCLYYFNSQNDELKKLLTYSDISKNKPSEIKTDLAGKVYAQIDSKLYYLNADKTDFIDVALDRTIAHFSLSFEKKSVYFVDGQSERVYSTEELNNSCIEELALPDGYTVNSSTTSIDNLIGVKVRDGANVFGYSVSGQNVTFNRLLDVQSEYLKVGEILDKNSSEKFLLLVGKDQTVLVFDKDATTLDIPKNQDVPKVVYVTTPVHAYYLPKITKNEDYVANVNGEKLYIPLSSEIYPTAKLTFNETEFYFATFNVGETEYSLYVPKSFTSLNIESAKENKTFTTAKIKPTTIYLDKELKNVLTATTENLNVRLFSDKDGVLEIEYFNGETWVRGYVSGSALLNEPNTAIRNILIVLAVITCACGSITFFIIRKKQKE